MKGNSSRKERISLYSADVVVSFVQNGYILLEGVINHDSKYPLGLQDLL